MYTMLFSFLFFISSSSFSSSSSSRAMASRSAACVLSCCWVLLILVPSCSPEPAVATVDVHAAKDLVCSGHRYLDVRTVEEFNKGHPEGALNVPYMFFTPQGRVKNTEFVEQVSKICSKDDHVVVGCASGVRSLQATADLLSAGFNHVKNMGGGFAAWTENGFAVRKPQSAL
uniref:Rhodanese-like domain-containing protein 19, mitochondrial n=1 Tax=Anthurium amnicola TaxID=1678845 RepID=A0A1D1YSW6_9ARAE